MGEVVAVGRRGLTHRTICHISEQEDRSQVSLSEKDLQIQRRVKARIKSLVLDQSWTHHHKLLVFHTYS